MSAELRRPRTASCLERDFRSQTDWKSASHRTESDWISPCRSRLNRPRHCSVCVPRASLVLKTVPGPIPTRNRNGLLPRLPLHRAHPCCNQSCQPWLAEQANPTNRNQSIGDVGASIRAADEWLSKFALAERQFAVMLTGFQSRRPFFRVLSNFQDGSGQRLPRVTERLQLFQSNARAPSTIAFGVGFSSVQHRDHLASLLARNAHAAIPEAMAHANAATASTTSTVGSECVVGWLQPTGDGQVIPFVRQIDGYFPDWVIRELRAGGVVGWEPKFDAQGKELRPGFTGMTFRIDRAATKGATLATMMSMRNVAALVRDPSIRSAAPAPPPASNRTGRVTAHGARATRPSPTFPP